MLKIEDIKNTIIEGDSLNILKQIPDKSINMVITSPPYWGLRDYGITGQIGLETNFNDYINNLIKIFNEVKRVLTDDGVCWVNIGDSYSKGKKRSNNVLSKSLCCVPDRFKIAMVDNGWICRNEIIWHKPNAMPSSVKDRFTNDFEKVFFFTKNKKYFFNQQKEPVQDTYNGRRGSSKTRKKFQSAMCGDHSSELKHYTERNKRTVWSISTQPFKDAHFAVYPEELIETPIKAGSPEDGIILDMFMGSGTTGLVVKRLNRNYIGIELNPQYIEIANKRIKEG